MMRSEDPLCCCEYYSKEGERSHLLALCCDCVALDEAVDSLVSGGGVRPHLLPQILDTVEERLRLPWPGGAVRIPLGRTAPLVLVPGLVWLASLHLLTALLTFLVILPLLVLLSVRLVIKLRPDTKFFLYCSYSTAATLLYVYEVKCVGTFWDLPKLISWWENLVLVAGMLGMFLSYRRLRSEFSQLGETGGKMCRICGVTVAGRDHHCVWLDLCVGSSNLSSFTAFLSLTTLTCCHLSLLLSSQACPGPAVGPLVLPSPCWPPTHNERLLLVSGIFSALLAALLALLLLGQICRKIRSQYSVRH